MATLTAEEKSLVDIVKTYGVDGDAFASLAYDPFWAPENKNYLKENHLSDANLKAAAWASILIPTRKTSLTWMISKSFQPYSRWRGPYLQYVSDANEFILNAKKKAGGYPPDEIAKQEKAIQSQRSGSLEYMQHLQARHPDAAASYTDSTKKASENLVTSTGGKTMVKAAGVPGAGAGGFDSGRIALYAVIGFGGLFVLSKMMKN